MLALVVKKLLKFLQFLMTMKLHSMPPMANAMRVAL